MDVPVPDILSLSEPLASRFVSDEAFGAAYEAVSEADRARLKLCVARLHALCRPQRIARSEIATAHDEGFVSTLVEEPLAFAAVLAERVSTSPAKLLAACLPPLCAGVRTVLAVLPPHPDPAVLTALELAGIEDVLVLENDEVSALLEHLSERSEPGILLSLDDPSAGGAEWGHQRWVAQRNNHFPARFGVCLDPESEEGLAVEHQIYFLHPEAEIHWNPDPETFSGDALVSAELCGSFPATDPTHAGVWVWPELMPEMFRVRRVTLREAP